MKRSSVGRDPRALRKTFERILLACAVAPGVAVDACSSTSTSPSSEAVDASTSAPDDAAANDDAIADAALACMPTTIAVDASNPDGGIECGIFEQYSCTLPPSVQTRSDCYFGLNDCASLCPGVYFFNCRAYGNWCVDGSILSPGERVPLEDGATAAQDPVVVECQSCPNGAGRRPRGLVASARVVASSALGSYFASVAHLEAASVVAFRSLRRELLAHDVPARLAAACARAADDEVRHARTTARLARRNGAAPPRVRVARSRRTRTLEEIALENAVEGCVRETFGALLLAWQAAHARDADTARALRSITADETRHAALSWRIDAWAASRLEPAARLRIRRARRAALRNLRSTIETPHADVAWSAGVPSAIVQRRLLCELERAIFE